MEREIYEFCLFIFPAQYKGDCRFQSSLVLFLKISLRGTFFFYLFHLPYSKNHIHAMANTAPLILRLVSSCIPTANHAGKIIRDVLKKGELNIVDKVM